MLIADAALVVLFSIGLTAILFKKEDEITKWANSKHGKGIRW